MDAHRAMPDEPAPARLRPWLAARARQDGDQHLSLAEVLYIRGWSTGASSGTSGFARGVTIAPESVTVALPDGSHRARPGRARRAASDDLES